MSTSNARTQIDTLTILFTRRKVAFIQLKINFSLSCILPFGVLCVLADARPQVRTYNSHNG